MRKKSIFLLSIILILSSCNRYLNNYKKGNYDKAIEITVKKLRTNPDNNDAADVLVKSYNAANRKDLDRINYLNTEGQPNRWEEIYTLYKKLKHRQELVESVSPIKVSGKKISFDHKDYNKQIVNAKRNAAEYLYVLSKKLISKNDIYAARDAYYKLKHLQHLYPYYKDTDNLIAKARDIGTIKVVVYTSNTTRYKINKKYLNNILPNEIDNLNSEWVSYFYNYSHPDYNIKINLTNISCSPELIKEDNYVESKKIHDGWEYVLDQNGNVMKDSLGNDIKRPKYKEIKCFVRKTLQRREIRLKVNIVYKNLLNNKLIKTIPVDGFWFIENEFAVANGDLRAASNKTLELTKHKPILMPDDFHMIHEGIKVMQQAVKHKIAENKSLIQ